MSENIDTNINNYSKEEILEILGLSKNESDIDVIQKKLDEVIKKFKAEGNSKLLKFFKEAKEAKNFFSEEEEAEEEAEANMWLREQFLKQKNMSQMKRRGERERQIGFFENTSQPLMLRNNLQINNTIPLDVGQGNLNPTFKQKIVRTVIINSAFRNNTFPFKNNTKNESSATNFTCSLSVPLRKVLKMTLNSVFIPTTFNVFDDNICNTVFWVKNKDNGQGSGQPQIVRIQNGTYNIHQLKDELEQALSPHPPINVELSDNKKKIKFTSVSGYQFDFLPPDGYNSLDGHNCSGSNINLANINYNNCLGNYLGFRLLSHEISGLEQEIPGKMPTTFKKNLENNDDLEAEVTPNLHGSNYFNLIIDDFNNNHPTNRLVTIGNNDDRLSLPTYYNKIVNNSQSQIDNGIQGIQGIQGVDCCSSDKITRVLPSKPRVLTQNQLFSINNILENRATRTTRFNESNSSNNVLATIQLPDIFESIGTSGEAYLKQLKNVISISNFDSDMVERSYFGPVLIQRLRVSLVDYLGNLVNLNGHNWSFTLKVEELYEY
tara:strand:+ start:14234 stop:15877 length:1644 start_codon:yes stop_codon:yes gene_type:complete